MADELEKDFRERFPDRVMAGWLEQGTVTLQGIFAWWWEAKFDRTTIAEIAEQECSMYRHHMRQTGKDANTTIPIMLHSLIQQLVRQDPALYRLIVTLRPDHKWRLMSYPCFLQGTLPENIVQGAVAIPDTMSKEADEWEKEDFRLFSNREAMANLPPMMSPGFLAVEDDLSSLEIPGLGTVADLTWAHKELQTPAWHPVEETRKYEGLSEPLGAATELGSLGALSDALVRRRSWRSPLVLREVEVVLGEPKAADRFFRSWKQQAVQKIVKAFQVEQATEKELYGADSYFRWVEEHPGQAFFRGDPDPSPRQTKELFDKYCG